MTLWQRWRKVAIHNQALVIVGLLAFVFTAINVGIVSVQAYVSYKGGKESAAQTDRLISNSQKIAESLKDSAMRAQDALNASLKSSQEDRRAWIVPYMVYMVPPLEAGKRIPITVWVRNSGKTPATARFAAHMSITNGELNDDTLQRQDEPDPARGVIVPPEMPPDIFTQLSLSVPVPEALTAQQTTDINAGAAEIYIVGTITYVDAFGGRHTSRLCYWLKGGDWKDGKMRPYWKGNSAD